MKDRNKKLATPTSGKDTKENKSGNFFRQLKSAIVQKCSSSGIKLNDMEERLGGFIVYGHTIGRTSLCPHCGKPSRSVHDHRLRKLQSTEFLGKNVQLVLRVRHFRCRNPECTCHTFSEPLKIAGPYSRMTDEANERVRYESLNQSARLACESLSRQHVHVGKSTCIRRAKALGSKNPEGVRTSGYVGIDDLAYRKRFRYMCGIVDHYTRKPLALFDSRYGNEIGDWLKAHPEIRLVTRDGSMSYASIISKALPDIPQVSDRFHLIENLRKTMVESIRKRMEQSEAPQPYPYPSEQEAVEHIREAIYSMGEAVHRTRIKDYFAVREMRDAGMRIDEISRETGLCPTRIYRLQNMRLDKLLNKDQKACLRHAGELARHISAKCITPEALVKRMEGKLKSGLVCRCVRGLVKKYKELRKEVKEKNARKKDEGGKVKKKEIWDYILTGKTECKKLQELHKSHPQVKRTIDFCISFINTLFDRKESMTLAEWIEEAEKEEDEDLKSYTEYIKNDKAAVQMACTTNYSNGVMEGTVNKIKEIKRTMFNRAGIELLRAKVLYANYGNVFT